MSAIASEPLDTHNSLFRPIVLGGSIIFIVQLIIQSWLIPSVLQQIPFIVVLQYMASGALGESAFAGGTGTALLGVFFHLIVSFVVAGVFILSADRIALLRRYAIPAALLYGFGVWVVMHLIIMPLSAAPPVPTPDVPWLIEEIIEHIVVVGLPLGILVRGNAHINK